MAWAAAAAANAREYERLKGAFIDAGATSPAHAKSLDELGCRTSRLFRWLAKQRVFVETSRGRYYFDAQQVPAAHRQAHIQGFLMFLAIAVPLLLVIWLIKSLAGG